MTPAPNVAEKNRTKGESPTAVFRSPSRRKAAKHIPSCYMQCARTPLFYNIILPKYYLKTVLVYLIIVKIHHFLSGNRHLIVERTKRLTPFTRHSFTDIVIFKWYKSLRNKTHSFCVRILEIMGGF
jgi:hypothetical protein